MALHAQKGLTDMGVLAKFRQKCPNFIDPLPIIPEEYAKTFPLRSMMGHTPYVAQVYSMHFDQFNSIFDAAAIGQFLGGNNPIHQGAHVGFINESCLFNPANMQYIWLKDKKNRKVPYVELLGKQYRINNLHIHSKKLKAFSSKDY